MNKSILVIGGTGFIGRNLIKFLLKKKFNISSISLKKKKIKKQKNLKNFFFDVSNKKKCSLFFKNRKFDYVINLAGYVDHRSFFSKNTNIINYHLLSTINTVYYLNKKNLKKYIYVGSSDEYGLNKSPQNENYREMPISTYSFSKTAATHFLQMIARSENFPSVILRIFLTYGPDQNINRFIPQIISGCLKDDKFKTSSGEQIRNFCYIDDVIRAIYLSMISKKSIGQVFNIGTDKSYKIKDVVMIIRSLIKKGMPEYGKIKLKKNENLKLYPDITKIKRILRWKPKISFRQGLSKTIKYFKNQKCSKF